MSIRRSIFAMTAAAVVIMVNLFVVQPALNAETQVCPSPRPACAVTADCKVYTCKICFANPLGLHCTTYE